MSDHSLSRRLLTVSQWNQYHPWPSPAGLRHLIFYARSNGFDQVMRRVGRRVLIDESQFFRWLDEQQGEVSPVRSSYESNKVKKSRFTARAS